MSYNDYKHPTKQEIDALRHGDLVFIVWSGGNKGKYRVHVDEYGCPSAIVASDYNEEGQPLLGREDIIKCMVNYNRINRFDVWQIDQCE